MALVARVNMKSPEAEKVQKLRKLVIGRGIAHSPLLMCITFVSVNVRDQELAVLKERNRNLEMRMEDTLRNAKDRVDDAKAFTEMRMTDNLTNAKNRVDEAKAYTQAVFGNDKVDRYTEHNPHCVCMLTFCCCCRRRT